ncbi:unnamed protein product, partial [Ilex paraguariensis]
VQEICFKLPDIRCPPRADTIVVEDDTVVTLQFGSSSISDPEEETVVGFDEMTMRIVGQLILRGAGSGSDEMPGEIVDRLIREGERWKSDHLQLQWKEWMTKLHDLQLRHVPISSLATWWNWIYGVFGNELPAALKDLPLDHHLSSNNVRKDVADADGYHPRLIDPEPGYRRLINGFLGFFKSPKVSVDTAIF